MIGWLKKIFASKPSAETTKKEISTPVGPVNQNTEGHDGMFDTTREQGWIGVDLDGTLAYYDKWRGFDHIGKPIPGILIRVREWLAQGYHVKIMTARASVPEGIPPVKKWLVENGLPELEVTCQKDFHMIELWDDRAVQVVHNSGSPVLSARWGALPRAPLFGIERRDPVVSERSGSGNSGGSPSAGAPGAS